MLISINIIIIQSFKYKVNCNYLLIIRFKIFNFFAKSRKTFKLSLIL